MAEYVELNLVIEALAKIASQTPFGKSKTVAKCIDAVELLPSSPHIPRFQRGRWIMSREYNDIIDMDVTKYTCSVCEQYRLSATMLSQATDYCPNCGARMDLGGADNA